MVWHGPGKNSKVQEMRFHKKNVLELPHQPKGGAGDQAWLGRTSLVRQELGEDGLLAKIELNQRQTSWVMLWLRHCRSAADKQGRPRRLPSSASKLPFEMFLQMERLARTLEESCGIFSGCRISWVARK